MNAGIQSGKESKLIAAILAGDPQLYHHLIRPYERTVYLVSLSCMTNEREADEVAQETFIRAFRDLSAFHCDCDFGAWLIGIAIDEARIRLRHPATTRAASRDEPQREEMPATPALLRDWQELPPDVVNRQEIRNLLRQAVSRLPTSCRQVFLLRDVEALGVNDTAQLLGIDTSLVKITLHRARMILQRLLASKLKAINQASKKTVSVSMRVRTLGSGSPQA